MRLFESGAPLGRGRHGNTAKELPREHQDALDALDLGLLRCDLEGRVVWSNAVARNLALHERMPAEILKGNSLLFDGVRYRGFPVMRGGRIVEFMVRAQRDVLREADAVDELREAGATPQQIRCYLATRRGEKSHTAGLELGISARTVEEHLQALYRRFGSEVHGFKDLERVLTGRRPVAQPLKAPRSVLRKPRR